MNRHSLVLVMLDTLMLSLLELTPMWSVSTNVKSIMVPAVNLPPVLQFQVDILVHVLMDSKAMDRLVHAPRAKASSVKDATNPILMSSVQPTRLGHGIQITVSVSQTPKQLNSAVNVIVVTCPTWLGTLICFRLLALILTSATSSLQARIEHFAIIEKIFPVIIFRVQFCTKNSTWTYEFGQYVRILKVFSTSYVLIEFSVF